MLKSILLILFVIFSYVLQGQLKLVLPTGNKGNVVHIKFHPSKAQLLSLDSYNQIVLWDIKKKQQLDSYFLKEDITGVDYINDSIIVIAGNKSLNYWNINNHTLHHTELLNNRIRALKVVNQHIYWISDALYIKKSITEKPYKIIDLQLDYKDFFISKNEDYYILPSTKNIDIIKASKPTEYLKLKTPLLTESVCFDSKKNILIVANQSGAIDVYSFSDAKFSKIDNQITDRKSKNYKAITITANIVWFAGENKTLTKYDWVKKKVLKNKKSNAGKIYSIAVQEKNAIVAIGCDDGVVTIFNSKNLNQIHSFKQVSPNINFIHPSRDSVSVILGYDNGQLKKWNFKSHEVQTIDIPQKIFDPIFNRQYEVVTINKDRAIIKRYVYDNLIQKESKLKFYTLFWNQDFTIKSFDKTVKPKTTDNSLIYTNLDSQYDFITATHSIDKKTIYASGKDGFLYFIDASTNDLNLKAFSNGKNDFFYATPENYYFASKSALKSVGALYNGKLMGFEQVDIIYNRPDKIIATFPYASEAYVKLLEKAYQKRLNKLDIPLNQSDKNQLESLPEIKTDLNTLPIQSEEQEIKIQIEVFSNGKVDLKALHIIINGVPIYGKSGYEISGHKISTSQTISLSSGKNKIQVFAENIQGVKSYREETNINLNQEYQPKLYVLSIGSNRFKNDIFNLNYAAKDAEEFTKLIKESPSFQVVKTQLITSENVTKETVFDAVQKISKAGLDDVVIVFYAGHGILDAELNYYLSTYGMNFKSPNENGILYSDLEDKLSELKCRNKLLFVDACHSGEIDKSEVSEVASQEIIRGDIQFRAGLRNIKLNGDQSVFQLSKTLFADLRNNSGVLTISSAGADEYALEGSKWKNGAFTYGILQGLSERKADLNNDKMITSTELKTYLIENIPIMTNGVQTPTTRVEVLQKDIRLW